MVEVIKGTAIAVGDIIAKLIPFPGEHIAALLLIFISLFIGARIINNIPPLKNKAIPWIIVSGLLFYLGWFFN